MLNKDNQQPQLNVGVYLKQFIKQNAWNIDAIPIDDATIDFTSLNIVVMSLILFLIITSL